MLGPACARLIEMWDTAVAEFLAGGHAVPDDLAVWVDGYRGTGRGEVIYDAFPEPYIGALDAQPAGVFLALNPGHAHLDFQSRNGIFANEIRTLGSYSAWARTWPYLRDPWISSKGRNRHRASRAEFLRRWHGSSALDGSAMVGFELYPWHSAAVTALMKPSPSMVRRWVWEPVAELRAPVFAFGAPWFPILENALRLRVLARLGVGGTGYGSRVRSRSVAVLRDEETGVTVIAERHTGGAGPPSLDETERLRDAVERWL